MLSSTVFSAGFQAKIIAVLQPSPLHLLGRCLQLSSTTNEWLEVRKMMNAILLSLRQPDSGTPLYSSRYRMAHFQSLPISKHTGGRQDLGIEIIRSDAKLAFTRSGPQTVKRRADNQTSITMLSKDKITWSQLALSALFFPFQPGAY